MVGTMKVANAGVATTVALPKDDSSRVQLNHETSTSSDFTSSAIGISSLEIDATDAQVGPRRPKAVVLAERVFQSESIKDVDASLRDILQSHERFIVIQQRLKDGLSEYLATMPSSAAVNWSTQQIANAFDVVQPLETVSEEIEQILTTETIPSKPIWQSTYPLHEAELQRLEATIESAKSGNENPITSDTACSFPPKQRKFARKGLGEGCARARVVCKKSPSEEISTVTISTKDAETAINKSKAKRTNKKKLASDVPNDQKSVVSPSKSVPKKKMKVDVSIATTTPDDNSVITSSPKIQLANAPTSSGTPTSKKTKKVSPSKPTIAIDNSGAASIQTGTKQAMVNNSKPAPIQRTNKVVPKVQEPATVPFPSKSTPNKKVKIETPRADSQTVRDTTKHSRSPSTQKRVPRTFENPSTNTVEASRKAPVFDEVIDAPRTSRSGLVPQEKKLADHQVSAEKTPVVPEKVLDMDAPRMSRSGRVHQLHPPKSQIPSLNVVDIDEPRVSPSGHVSKRKVHVPPIVVDMNAPRTSRSGFVPQEKKRLDKEAVSKNTFNLLQKESTMKVPPENTKSQPISENVAEPSLPHKRKSAQSIPMGLRQSKNRKRLKQDDVLAVELNTPVMTRQSDAARIDGTVTHSKAEPSTTDLPRSTRSRGVAEFATTLDIKSVERLLRKGS